MKTWNQILPFIMATLLLTGCSASISVPQRVEPEIRLETDSNKMLIQNYFNYQSSPSIKNEYRHIYESAIHSFAESITNYLSDDLYISAVQGNLQAQRPKGQSRLDPLDSTKVSQLCKKHETNLLLSIDSVAIDIDWELEVEELDDGSKSKTKHFYLISKHYLSLYTYNGILYDQKCQQTRKLYKSRPSLGGLLTVNPSLKKAEKTVIEMSKVAGKDYGNNFFESQESTFYQAYFSKPFAASFQHMMKNNWQLAITDLLPIAESSKPKIARRAAHNLSICYTALGDKEAAREWFLKSVKQ